MAKKTRAPATKKSPTVEDKRVPAITGERNYIDLKPESKWSSDEDTHTLVINLPYFKLEDINVSVDTSNNTVSVKCESQIPLNIWMRFAGDFPLPEKCNVNEVKAKYENGLLSVKFPKIVNEDEEEHEEGHEEGHEEDEELGDEEDETMKKMSKHGVDGQVKMIILTGVTILIVLVVLWMSPFKSQD
ncbi:Small heat shock protein HSP20 protein [Dioscorea alata]|uniref:Small heat shock protein HSP20 protein n=1 Tax=Dioscorea alata TaxID=55571 RepID=A0ACB7UMG8_DIOAL|nr:Small heat shock protein HSP20 protein [Dioscorea alata]